MRRTYIAKWEREEEYMVFRADGEVEIFDCLDRVGDPSDAEVRLLPKEFCISFFGMRVEEPHFDFKDFKKIEFDAPQAFVDTYGHLVKKG